MTTTNQFREMNTADQIHMIRAATHKYIIWRELRTGVPAPEHQDMEDVWQEALMLAYEDDRADVPPTWVAWRACGRALTNIRRYYARRPSALKRGKDGEYIDITSHTEQHAPDPAEIATFKAWIESAITCASDKALLEGLYNGRTLKEAAERAYPEHKRPSDAARYALNRIARDLMSE